MEFQSKNIALQRGSTTTAINNYSSGGSGSAYVPLNYLSLVAQSTNLAGANGVIKLPLSNYLLTDNGWNFSTVNTDGTFTDLMTLDSNGNLSVKGEVCAFGVTSGGSGSGGLIQTVFGYANLGGSFSNATLTDTFNAYTINQMNNRLIGVENGALTQISSTLVTNALGYVPYNSTNPNGFITASSLAPYALTAARPTNLSQFNNNLGNYGGWITGINSGMVTTALGYTPLPTRTFGSAASSNTGDFVSSSGTLGSSITLGTVYNGTANQSVPTNLLGGYSNGYVYNFTQNQIQSWLGLGSSAYTNNNDHILNQNSSAQSANMWISGDVTAYGKGKFGVTYHSVELRALDSDYGSAMYLYADGGTDQRVYRIANKYSGSGTDLVIDYSDARAYNTEAIAHTYTERFRLSKTGAVTFTSTVNATQLQSTVATGTAPLTVNSTTMVGNLNAEMVNGLKYYGADFASTVSYVMVYDAPNARMSPATSTQIRNFIGVNNIATQDLSSLSTNYIPKWNGSNFVNSLISDDGTNASARGDYFAINIPSNNYSGKLKFGSGSSFDYFISSGDNYGSMIFNSVGQWGNKAFTFNYATTPLLTIESNGVVSIPNTTQSLSPSTGALVLNGGMGINGRLSLPSGSGWVGMLSFDHNVSNGSSRKWFIHTDYQSYGDFAITTQSTQSANTVPDIGRFYISPNGNTGIGYISDQGYKLAVNGTLMATGTVNTYAGEGIKMIADAAYLSGYNSANTVRQGYLQFTGNAVYISAESGTGDIALINKSAVLIRNDVGGEARIQLQGSQAGVKQYYIKNSIQGISNTGFSIRNASDGTTPFYIDGSDNSHFNGNVTASNFILSSDRTLKTNIQPIIKDYSRLNLVSFNFKNNLEELRFGTIAQDLLSNGFSEFVVGNREGEYKVKYIDLIIAKLASAESRIKQLEEKYVSSR